MERGMDVKYHIYVIITECEELDQNDNEKKLDSLVEAGNLSKD